MECCSKCLQHPDACLFKVLTTLRMLTGMPWQVSKDYILAPGTAALTSCALTHSLCLQAQMAQLQGQLQDVGALVASHTETAARAATDGLAGLDGLQRTYASEAHQVCGCCCASVWFKLWAAHHPQPPALHWLSPQLEAAFCAHAG